MKNSQPRIKVKLNGNDLLAFLAITQEFNKCGKIGNVSQVPSLKEEKQFKLNDDQFVCIYEGIIRALNGPRYPSKSGNEYQALCRVKESFRRAYKEQRNSEL